MKNTSVLIVIILLSMQTISQTVWLNPYPSGYINTKIHFENENDGFLLNQNGDFYKTSNSGNSWNFSATFKGAYSFSIKDSTGIIPTLGGDIYITTDNGRSWEKKLQNFGVLDNHFAEIISKDTLLILKINYGASKYELYRSDNRGNTWQLINNNIPLANRKFDFVNSKIGYSTASDGIYKTADGGISWQKIYSISSSAGFTSIKFYNSLVGFVQREIFGMLRTTDGGITWEQKSTPQDRLNDIFFIDQTNAFAVGELGVVYKTADGGSTWTYISPNPRIYANDLYTLYFFNSSKGIVAGHRGQIYYTSDGGSSWRQQSPTYTNVTSVSFPAKDTGYFTTWNNIFKTTDKGKTWDSLSLEVGFTNYSRFEHSFFKTKDSGLVTASLPARIYRTVDGGQTWTLLNIAPYSYETISDLVFVNNEIGYASLRNGNSSYGLFKTTDGGLTWNEIGSYQNFYKLQFLNENLGYATGYDKIFRTVNGGVTWTTINIPSINGVRSVHFLNAKTGFITGDIGYLYRTVDSGKTWIAPIQNNYSYPDYRNIRFYNQKVGYLTDDEGRFYKTIDGGITWNKAGETAFYECNSIYFRADTSIILGGIYGTLVSSNIPEYRIDSVSITLKPCSITFNCNISSALIGVDSSFLEYGNGNFLQSSAVSTSQVIDTAIKYSISIQNLLADSTYKLRLKIYSKNNFYYSDTINFIPPKAPPPVITKVNDTLYSSYTDYNQWYFNGNLINGATLQYIKPTNSGIYNVTSINNGCITHRSSDFNYIFTSDNFLLYNRQNITFFPNPINQGVINIKIPEGALKLFHFKLLDLRGRALLNQILYPGINIVNLTSISNGVYFIEVIDSLNKIRFTNKIIKRS